MRIQAPLPVSCHVAQLSESSRPISGRSLVRTQPWQPRGASSTEAERRSPKPGGGSSNLSRLANRYCPVAQPVERRAVNAQAGGSKPPWTASSMVVVAQPAESRAVNPDGVGANPTDHPNSCHIQARPARERRPQRIRRRTRSTAGEALRVLPGALAWSEQFHRFARTAVREATDVGSIAHKVRAIGQKPMGSGFESRWSL